LSASTNAILHALNSIKQLLDKSHQKKGRRLLVLTTLVSIADVIGLAAVVPILMLAIDGDFLEKSSKLRYVFAHSGLPSEASFLIILIISVVIFFAIKNILAVSIQNSIQKLCTELVQKFTEKTFYHSVNQNYLKIVANGTSELLQKIHFNSFYYATGILLPFIGIIGESVIVVFVILFIMWFNPLVFLLIALITGPAFYFINKTIKNRVYALGQKAKDQREKTIESLNIGINGLADIKINHTSSYFIKDFLGKQRPLLEYDFKSIQYQLIPSRANEFVVLIGVIVLVIYGYFFSHNPGGLRLLGAIFVLSVFRLIPALNRLLVALMKIKHYQYTIDFLRNNDTVSPQHLEHPILVHQKIELFNIGFKYADSSANLLSNIHLAINKGDIIGITGNSGSGKSTLLKIIAGLIKPNEGEIRVDGKALQSEQISSWQNQLGFVHQSPFIFNKSVIENITFSEVIDDEKLNRAIENSGICEFINTLPNGMHTILGEQGVKISEGQKQRIAIARALYKNAKVLLFDEATSALDAEAEQIIIESLKKLKDKQVTILIIAHQNRILHLCDQVYKIKEGILTKND